MSNDVLVEEGGGTVVEIQNAVTVIQAQADQATVIQVDPEYLVVDEQNITQVVVSSDTATVLEILHVLPTETIPEEEQVYAKRVDFVSDTVIYRGEAAVGTLESEPLWRVRRLTLAVDDDVTEEWANGNANFTNVWDNRASFTYV